MDKEKKIALLFAFIAALIVTSDKSFATSPFRHEIKDVAVKFESSYWVSEWVEFELPSNLASFQIISFGAPNVHLQITDLIAPDQTAYVQSEANSKLHTYSHPIIKNALSLNRTSAVVKGMSSVIVPNNPRLPSPPAGVWRFRALNHNKPDILKNSFVIIGRGKEDLVKNRLDIRVWVSPETYWTKTPGHVDKILEETRSNLSEAGLELRILSVELMTEKWTRAMKLPDDMANIAAKQNATDALNVYFMPAMEYQSKPVNGLACIAAPVDSDISHPCFASLYADPAVADSVRLENQGKILTHEIGHYLGLYHTKDTGYYLVNEVFDTLTDTPEKVTGTNMMDPGLHDETPHFSPQQKEMLRLSPILQ